MRVTIYLPDDLAQALERWRGEINTSAICQAALQNEIKRLQAQELKNWAWTALLD